MDLVINSTDKLARMLRVLRKRMGITQENASNRSGLLPKTVSLLENHPERCSVETLLKHLSALHLELYISDSPTWEEIIEKGRTRRSALSINRS